MQIPIATYPSAFGLADAVNQSAVKNFNIFLDFLFGKPTILFSEIEPEKYGFKLVDIIPNQRIRILQRGNIKISIAESFDSTDKTLVCQILS